MQNYANTSLWQSSFGESAFERDAEARSRLSLRLLDIRARATQLIGRLSREIADTTVHDVTHLDALWETASLVAGPGYVLNPAEAFVFGAAILLNDPIMSLAVFPGGLEEIKKTPQLRDAIASHLRPTESSRMPDLIDSVPAELVRAALFDILRDFQGSRASELAFAEWPSTGGAMDALVQDRDLRNTYGNVIGLVAASNWQPASNLASLPPRVNAGPGVPIDWYVDPLKVACLLRAADAAHIDHRRPQRYLRDILQMSGMSPSEWSFQTRLGKPSIDRRFLVYTGNPFEIGESETWWHCYDMISRIDAELRSTHDLLEARAIPTFDAVSVKGARSPETIATLIPTRGWKPVDTALKVSNLPSLVKLLGGEMLYGANPAVPLRALLQNAADGIRARRLLGNLDSPGGQVTVRLRTDKSGAAWLDVEDDGVGISPAALTGALLDFGAPFWGSETMRREFPGLQSKGLRLNGAFGIGFFSVFMLGDEVVVTSLRHDAAPSDAHTLHFRSGPRMRPVLRAPFPDELLPEPGTRVSVRLRTPPDQPKGLLHSVSGGATSSPALRRFVARNCLAVDVTVRVVQDNQLEIAVAANDWLTEEPKTLLLRTSGPSSGLNERNTAYVAANLRELKDGATGEIHGRACISLGFSVAPDAHGVITVGGLYASRIGHIVGILKGNPGNILRDTAVPTVPAAALAEWSTEQATLISASKASGEEKLQCAQIVMLLGGFAPKLPVAVMDGAYLTAQALESAIRRMSEVEVYAGTEVHYDEDDKVSLQDFKKKLAVAAELFFVPTGTPAILNFGGQSWPQCLPGLYVPDHVANCHAAFRHAMAGAWGSVPEPTESKRTVGTVGEIPVERSVKVYVRPADSENY